MSRQEKLTAGNNLIYADAVFADGYCNGNLFYYDANHQLPRPLTSDTLLTFIQDNLRDPRASERWNVGFVCGWLVAMCENQPDLFFTSVTLPIDISQLAAKGRA